MTRAGRLPACSWPACGLNSNQTTSPRSGMYPRATLPDLPTPWTAGDDLVMQVPLVDPPEQIAERVLPGTGRPNHQAAPHQGNVDHRAGLDPGIRREGSRNAKAETVAPLLDLGEHSSSREYTLYIQRGWWSRAQV